MQRFAFEINPSMPSGPTHMGNNNPFRTDESQRRSATSHYETAGMPSPSLHDGSNAEVAQLGDSTILAGSSPNMA